MMLTSIFSSDFLVVVNSIFRKREPGDHHRGDNQATVFSGKNESPAIFALCSACTARLVSMLYAAFFMCVQIIFYGNDTLYS